MPSASVRASSASFSSSAMRASSLARSAATAASISRLLSAICSSSRAWCFITAVSLSLSSLIFSSFSAAALFQLSRVLLMFFMVSACALRRFSSICFSFERLLAKMSRPAGPSSIIWNRFSNMVSSPSNSSSLSSGCSASDFFGRNLPFLLASFSFSCSCLFCLFSLPHSSWRILMSFAALSICTWTFVLSLMASSRWTTARPTLSTRSATSFTRFLMEASWFLAWSPRCRSRTSWMCALRISFIMEMASEASFVRVPTSRFASSNSRCNVSDCSRPFLNSRSSLCACAMKASFFAEVMASWSCSDRTFRASFELSCKACW
mmetsp:Transcript_78422/g.229927  ORF Transcript_78422/g.229927 Transcript_78422/m.229927 type:complete len:321 (+) Transcript_78422:576-1538(+)